MEISFATHALNLQTNNGYGVAGYNVVTSLQKLGHTVPFNNESSPIQVNFCQPSYFADFLINRPNQHKIGYTAWESTDVPDDWPEIFDECDEVWATSDWTKRWYVEQGINCTKVYPHGIDPVWTPKHREPDGPFKFLHHGEPAPRKGGQLAYDAFIAAFGKTNKDVALIIKSSKHSTVRTKSKITGGLSALAKNVSVHSGHLEDRELRGFYHLANAMVYPSYGEGFGLIPFQALATGMPTICTGEWAQYRDLLGDLALSSTYVKSPWPKMHPGLMCEPSFDDLVDKYRYVYNNYDKLSRDHYRQALQIHKDYDWKKVTEKAFEHLVPKNFDIADSSPVA